MRRVVSIKDIRSKYFTQSMPPPRPGEEQTYEFASQMDMQISMDGGNSFKPFRARRPRCRSCDRTWFVGPGWVL